MSIGPAAISSRTDGIHASAGVLSAVMSVSALSSGIGAFAEEYDGIKYQSNGVHLGMSGEEFLDDDFVKGSVPPEIAPIVDAGQDALSDLIPGGSIVTGYLKLIIDGLLQEQASPTV